MPLAGPRARSIGLSGSSEDDDNRNEAAETLLTGEAEGVATSADSDISCAVPPNGDADADGAMPDGMPTSIRGMCLGRFGPYLIVSDNDRCADDRRLGGLPATGPIGTDDGAR